MNARFEKNQKKKKILFLCSGLMVIGLSVIFLLSGTFSILCTEIGFRQNVDDIETELEQSELGDLEVRSIAFQTVAKEDKEATVWAEITFESEEIEKYAEAEKDSEEARKLLRIMRVIQKNLNTINYAADTLTGWQVRIILPSSAVQIQDSLSRKYIYSSADTSYNFWQELKINNEQIIYDSRY